MYNTVHVVWLGGVRIGETPVTREQGENNVAKKRPEMREETAGAGKKIQAIGTMEVIEAVKRGKRKSVATKEWKRYASDTY